MTCGLMVAGERPSFASEKQNFASGVPIAMSQAATSPVPPAKAGPCTRAMVGLSSRARDGRGGGPASAAQVLVVAVAGHALHPVEIGPRAERRAVAGEQHDSHARI